MYRLAYGIELAITASWRWIRRRFTAAGLAVLGGVAVCWVRSFDMENSFTYQVFALLVALLAVALLGSGWFRLSFAAERRLPRYGSVDTPVRYRVLVRNGSIRAQTGLAVLENLAVARPSLAAFTARWKTQARRGRFRRSAGTAPRRTRSPAAIREGQLPTMLPQGEAEVTLEILPRKRGVIRWESVTLARPDPLGLFRSFATQALRDQVIILPKRYLLPPLALPGTTAYQQGGVALASSVGQSDEFVSLRSYRPGDPLRHIHWKTWARAGKPVVKEFEDEFFVRHALILDTFVGEPESPAFEEAVSVAASFACTVRTQESLLDLLFVGAEAYCFTAGRGVGHTEQLLEVLAAVEPCHQKPFTSLSHLVLDHAGAVSGCVIILLAWDEPRRELVQRLRALPVPVVVLVVVEPGQAEALRTGPGSRDGLHFLEVGRIEEGLARL